MFTHEQIEALPERIYKRLRDINKQYLEMLGRRVGETGDIIPSDVQKLQRIFETGADVEEMKKALAEASAKNIKEIEDIFDKVAKENYEYTKPFYEFRKKQFIPYEENEGLRRRVEALKRQSVNEYKNLTQTTGFLVYDKRGRIATKFGELSAVPTSLSETYQITLDNAVQAATEGIIDYQTAMRQTLRTLADSGIKTVDYASGYSRRLDTAVRQNILWGIKQCNQEVADIIGEEIGADGFEIDYHSNPRPSHAEMGGQMYAKGKGRRVNGVYYESIDKVQPLLDEYGCLHFKYSVILGISEPAYSKAELERLKAEDKKPITFEGQEISKYDASQKQRKLETAMRHCDDRLTIAKAAGNKELVLKETSRMTQLQNKYTELSKASGLPTQMERTVSGIKGTKKQLTNGGEGGIMKETIRKVNTDGLRNEKPLKKDEIDIYISYAREFGFEHDIIYSEYSSTAFVSSVEGDKYCRLVIGTDVKPIETKNERLYGPNQLISPRGAIAHEIIGHYEAWLGGFECENLIIDEAQASIRAARFAEGLTQKDRILLLKDAITRLKNGNIKLSEAKKKMRIDER